MKTAQVRRAAWVSIEIHGMKSPLWEHCESQSPTAGTLRLLCESAGVTKIELASTERGEWVDVMTKLNSELL